MAGSRPDPQLAQALEAVGQAYLEFDYRQPNLQRLRSIEPVVTPELFAALATPLPGPLAAELVMTETIITAELNDLIPLSSGVWNLHFTVVSQRRTETGSSTQEIGVRTVTASVNTLGLVEDVR